MSIAFPLPRQTRQAILTATAAQAVFGPFDFILFDADDVEVLVQPTGDDEWTLLDPSAVIAAPAAPYSAFPALFTVTLGVGRAAGDKVWIKGKRLGQRTSNVTQGGKVQSVPLETELDRQVATEQELRRDIDALMSSAAVGALVTASGVANDSTVTGGSVADVLEGLDSRIDILELASSISVTPEKYGAVASPLGTAAGSIADSTAAISQAIGVASVFGGTVQFGPGVYKTRGNIIAANNVFIKGSGRNTTTIVFAPTGPSVCLDFNAGAGILSNCGIQDITVGSADTTTLKVAINSSDTSHWRCINVSVAHYPVDGSLFRGAGSVGLAVHGRECGVVDDVHIYAEKPLVNGLNPNAIGGGLDSWVFSNLLLVAPLTNATTHVITADPGSCFINVRFDGHQNWIGGLDGFHWVAGGVAASQGLYISGVKDEQPGDGVAGGTGAGWMINIQTTGGGALWNLDVRDCMGGGRGNVKLRGVARSNLVDLFYDPFAANKAGLDAAGATCEVVRVVNCFWTAATTASLAGFNIGQYSNFITGYSTAIPHTATYLTTTITPQEFFASLNVSNLTGPNILGVVADHSVVAITGAPAAAADADSFASKQGSNLVLQTLGAVKTWIKAWIVKADVGLSNVVNLDTSTQANVAFTGLSAAAAAADADTFPTNQGAGNLKQTLGAVKTWIKAWITKTDVGLSNVANADTTNASNISSGTLNKARLDSTSAWTAYTPTLTALAGALGAGNTVTGFWSQGIGKTKHVRILITIGAAGIGTATQLSVSLPTTAAGKCNLLGYNETTGLAGACPIGTTVGLGVSVLATAGGGALVTANNHIAVISGTYEEA